MRKRNKHQDLLTFDEHLEVFRKLLFRILGVTVCFSVIIFCFKDLTFKVLLAPSKCNFITYRNIESAMNLIDAGFRFDSFHVDLITTDLSSQFMTHITTSFYLGLLVSSPYILYELFQFIIPALYKNERKYSVRVVSIIYFLFISGVFMSYYIIFPISFRFLGTYSVSESIHSTITLDSYISTFVSLTLLMGVVFQLPVVTYILAKMGLVDTKLMSRYRKHAFIIIMFVAAVITPPDIMTLIIVTIPLYMLYEFSIQIIKFQKNKDNINTLKTN